MKEAYKSTLSLMIAFILASGLSCDGGGDGGGVGFNPVQTVVGSGNIAQETRSVTGATDVELRGVANLTIEQGTPEELILQTDDNLLALILTDVQSGILVIRSAPGFNLEPSQTMEANLRLISIDSIMLTGVGDIMVPDATTTQLELTLSGVGGIKIIELDAQTSDVLISGIGDILVEGGQVDDQLVTLTLGSLGNYSAENLSSLTAIVEIAGSGSATIRVSTMLNANITGSGSVFYHGSPVVTRTGNGSGSLVQLSP
jgi:hypothetical protein